MLKRFGLSIRETQCNDVVVFIWAVTAMKPNTGLTDVAGGIILQLYLSPPLAASLTLADMDVLPHARLNSPD